MRVRGKSVEEIAKRLNMRRRALGKVFKDITPQPYRDLIYARNRGKYDTDPLGPTWQLLRQQGKSWEEIIESAQRPGNSFQVLSRLLYQALKR